MNLRVLILALAGWYLILAAGHYVNQRPLWNDEQCVFNNILELKPSQFFSRPLLNDQAFPRLYLLIIQQFTKIFGHGLLVLRFFSLVAMIAAFFVWLKIARRVWGDSWETALFTGAWCASMPMVYYAAELKPYSMDVLVCGLIVLFLLDKSRDTLTFQFMKSQCVPTFIEKVGAVPTFILPFLAWFSYPAIVLLFLPLYNLARESFKQKRLLPELLWFLSGCGLALLPVYFFDYRVSLPGLLKDYWHDYFISFDSLKVFFKSFGKAMNNLVGRRFAEDPRWVRGPSRIFIGLGVAYMMAVFWRQFKKDGFALRSLLPMAMAMFVLQLLLAVFWLYPFGVPRLSLFFSPLLFVVTVMALSWIRYKQRVLGLFLLFILAGYLVFVSLGIAWNVFIHKDLGFASTLYTSP